MTFFTEIGKIFPKFICNHRIAKTILRKKDNAEGNTLPNFKLCNKDTVIKTVWCWLKNGHIGQWNRVDSPQINSCIYGQLILGSGVKNTQCGKDKRYSFNK